MRGSGSSSKSPVVEITAGAARRLWITNQRLGPKRPRGSKRAAMISVVRDLCYVQWDPISVVAPSHVLAFWNRVPGFRPADLERLMWRDREMFVYYAHAAAVVLTEDLPIYASLMDRYPESLSSSWGNWRAQARAWIPAHAALRRSILRELRAGPKSVGEFEGHTPSGKDASGWGSSSDVANMLTHLLMSGEVTLVGQRGNQNVWGLTEQFLPQRYRQPKLSIAAVEQRAAERAIHALGVATPAEIRFYFTRGQYQDLDAALASLVEAGTIHPVQVEGLARGEERYISDRDLSILPSLEGPWDAGRISLLPPFDTLTCLREKARTLFGFDHFVEMYVPKAKRRYGYYVLPVLSGDRLVGRIDPKFDRSGARLLIQAVHAEPHATRDREIARALARRIEELAELLGAREVVYSSRVPEGWRTALG